MDAMTRREVRLPAQRRAATPTSYDAEAHTVDLVAATGFKVRRYDWEDGLYYEQLDVTAGAVDLSRVENGICPLLDAHSSWSVNDQLGVVTGARFEDSGLILSVRFGSREAALAAEAEVAAGTLRGVSVGYRRDEMMKEERSDGQIPTYTVTRWTLLEVSLVPVPADPASGVRTEDGFHPCSILNKESRAMTLENNAAGAPAESTLATADTRTATPAAGLTAQDVLALMDQARALGVETQARAAIEAASATRSSVSEAILASAAARQTAAATTVAAGAAGRAADPNEASRAAVTDALVARMLRRPPTDAARQYAGFNLIGLIAERAGISARDPDEVLRAAMHTTSDFPLLLADAGNKVLLTAYQIAQPTYKALAARRSFNDFKAHKFLRLGDFPALQTVTESGEIKSGTFGENKESVSLATKGIVVSLTRQAIINDDLGAFADLLAAAGRRAAMTENTMFFDLLNANSQLGPTLADGYTMFQAANHANYTSSGTAISVASLGVGRAAMRKQTGVGGIDILNVGPSILLTSPDKETLAQQFTVQTNPTQGSEVNPFSGRLSPIADANLTGNGWYLFADPMVLPNFIYGYLRDAEGPQLRQDMPFGVDGMSLSVLHDFGVGAVDYRGGYYNAGA